MVALQPAAATHFPGRFSCKANGHGRAMLAPTSVFRQSRGGVKTPPTPLYVFHSSLLSPLSYLLTFFRCSPCPKLQSCLHNKRSPLWKKSKQARSAVRPRRKASASATPPCANGCASTNPRAQTALHPGKSPATLPPRKSRPPWRSTSRAGSRCLTSAKSTASAARKTCKSSWKRRRRAASCAATTARPATGAARTPPPRTGKRSCGNVWPTAAITAQLR